MVTEFDRDCDNKLNEAEFRRLVRSCTKKCGYRLEASDELSLSEFIGVFDKDNDGSVDHQEFVDFMSGMMKMDRDDVVAQGEFGMLQWYVVECAKLRVKFLTFAVTELTTLVKAVRATGSNSSSDDCVSASELLRLIKNCELSLDAAKLNDLLPNLHKSKNKNGDDDNTKEKEFRVKDANKLIIFMDKNRDGELQTGEFIEAILRNIVQSKKSTRSQLKKEKLTKALEGMITVLRTETQRRVLVEASRVVFRRYDTKGNGEIDNNGLVEVVLGVSKTHNIVPPWETSPDAEWRDKFSKVTDTGLSWCQVLFDKMDKNGDGMLQEEEFCMYLGAAMLRERLTSKDQDNDKEDETRDEEDEDERENKLKLKGVLGIIDSELPMLLN
jgi:Ca2+-binding EF-hand superfamily protein